ncbi:MAG: HAD family phosphatase [Oscillibacter sp.]|nr:HAD family phosphatase [Oscillibacter sp.]
MLKLIASDIDGTLLPYGATAMSPELPGIIRRLRNAGVMFCPASGRQYHSVRTLFQPEIADQICFLCENGAVVFGPGPEENPPVLSKTPMPREEALALIREALALPGYDAFISGQFVGYICSHDPVLIRELDEVLDIRFQYVERPEDIPEDILELSVFCPNGPDRAIEALGPKRGQLKMAVSGPKWLDFNVADKGVGLRGLCEKLGVDLADAAVFGDNWNDVSMLEIAGHPYLMETADPALRARFPQQCASVIEVLKRILSQLEGG